MHHLKNFLFLCPAQTKTNTLGVRLKNPLHSSDKNRIFVVVYESKKELTKKIRYGKKQHAARHCHKE